MCSSLLHYTGFFVIFSSLFSCQLPQPSPCADMENLRRGEQQQDCPGIEQRRHQLQQKLHRLDTARKGGAAGGGVLQKGLQRMHTEGISWAISWCEWVYELSLTLWPSRTNTIINLIYVWFGRSITMVLSGQSTPTLKFVKKSRLHSLGVNICGSPNFPRPPPITTGDELRHYFLITFSVKRIVIHVQFFLFTSPYFVQGWEKSCF